MRSKLDEDGLGIATYQEESVKHRRQLAEATKGVQGFLLQPALAALTGQGVCRLPAHGRSTGCEGRGRPAQGVPGGDRQADAEVQAAGTLLPAAVTCSLTSAEACRAKFSEAAFLNVYVRLSEAPDPGPVLQWALVSPSRPCVCSTVLSCTDPLAASARLCR